MGLRVAINGTGKTDIQLIKNIIKSNNDIKIIAINCNEGPEKLLDTIIQNLGMSVVYTDKAISIDGHEIKYFSEKNYSNLPWLDLGIDILIETTDNKEPYNHIEAGAKKVLLNHPDDNADVSIVMGANEGMYNPERHKIISVMPPLVNCAAPILNALHKKFHVMKANITDIHAVDLSNTDNKNMTIEYNNTAITGYIGKVLPELQGRLNTSILNIPSQSVSLAEINAVVCKQTNVVAINEWLKEQSKNNLKGILNYSDKPMHPADFEGNTNSAIIDLLSTTVSDGNLVKVMALYNSESAYVQRVIDIIRYVGYYREDINNLECNMA